MWICYNICLKGLKHDETLLLQIETWIRERSKSKRDAPCAPRPRVSIFSNWSMESVLLWSASGKTFDWQQWFRSVSPNSNAALFDGSMQTSFCTADLSLKTGAASMCAWCTWLPWCRHLTTSQKWMNGLQVSNRSHCFFLTRLLVTIPSYYLVTSCQSRSSHRMRHLRQAAGGSASSSSALALSLGSLFKARRTTWEDQTWSNSDLNRSNKKEQERGLDGCWEQFYLISDGQVWPSCIAYLFSTLCWQRRRLRIDNLHNQCCHIWRSKWLH